MVFCKLDAQIYTVALKNTFHHVIAFFEFCRIS